HIDADAISVLRDALRREKCAHRHRFPPRVDSPESTRSGRTAALGWFLNRESSPAQRRDPSRTGSAPAAQEQRPIALGFPFLRPCASYPAAMSATAPTQPTSFPGEPAVDLALARAHKLSEEEWARACERLGRAPTFAELGVLSVMWSEH